MTAMPLRQAVQGHQHGQIRRAEVGVAGRRAEKLCTATKIALDERRRLDWQVASQIRESQRPERSDPALRRGKMSARQPSLKTGRVVAAIASPDAGTAECDVQSVLHDELAECRPEREDGPAGAP